MQRQPRGRRSRHHRSAVTRTRSYKPALVQRQTTGTTSARLDSPTWRCLHASRPRGPLRGGLGPAQAESADCRATVLLHEKFRLASLNRRLSGPSLLIEYDNTQDQANHIHSVWRDLRRDFARDLLAQHYAGVPTDQCRASRRVEVVQPTIAANGDLHITRTASRIDSGPD